jgi:integrase
MSDDGDRYTDGDYWLDKRRDGKSPDIWQIATKARRTVIYRSTRERSLERAKAALHAYAAEQRATKPQPASEADVAALVMTYWREHGRNAINADQTARSLRTFLAFLAQDRSTVPVVTDLNKALFERFRAWRMGPHSFEMPWAGKPVSYASDGVSGATVQRNVNDVRAAVRYAEDNLRIPSSPRIRDVPKQFRSPPRERLLTIDELGRMAWYASHNPDLFRYIALQLATAVRPDAARKFDPAAQYDPATNLIDLHPHEAPQTKKRNAIVPAIRPLRPVLAAWAREGAKQVGSHKTAWRNMRRVLDLSPDVHAKTIRHTVATMLNRAATVPQREVSELLGHEGELARTSRIYAKYRPEYLQNATRALGRIWLEVSRAARSYNADHRLTKGQRKDAFRVVSAAEYARIYGL